MAGHRRRAGKPKVRVKRIERRTANLNARLAAAVLPQDRIAVAADHYRFALTLHPDPDGAERMVSTLKTAGDDLLQQAAKDPK